MIPEEITLRDWFAGQAMQAFITAVRGTGGSIHDKEISQSSFYIADAMMEARNNER